MERLGIRNKVVGISEIDKFAVKSYEAIFGNTFNYGDIRLVPKLNHADFWTYSFPCQDISVSGKGAGINKNTRSGLLYQVERLLNAARSYNELPKYLMLENVKNLVGKKFKRQFDEWLKYLDELGYNNYWNILNAKDYGIPQNRERVFVISIRKDIDDGKFEFPKPFESNLRLKDLLEKNVDEKYYISQDKVDNFLNKFNILSTTKSSLIAEVAALQQVGTLKGCGMPYDKMHDQSGRVYNPNGIGPTVHTCGGGNLEPKILETPCVVAQRGRYKENNEIEQKFEINNTGNTNTITTVQKDNYLYEPHFRIRKLTPLECWRLMGFDDEAFEKAKSVNSNTQLYKQAGNSIVVNVLEYVFMNLLKGYVESSEIKERKFMIQPTEYTGEFAIYKVEDEENELVVDMNLFETALGMSELHLLANEILELADILNKRLEPGKFDTPVKAV